MATRTVLALLDVGALEVTNPQLDTKYVKDLAAGLQDGSVTQEELGRVYVRCMPDGYKVNDGNHRVTALKEAGVKSVLADVYRI